MKISRINELIDWLEEKPIGLSWTSPQTEVRQSLLPNGGNGRFATEDIDAEETVVLAGGIILTVEEYEIIESRWNFITGGQVDSDHILLQMGTGQYAATVNHTCKPNCYISGQICMKTMINIKKDEELSIDYGTICDYDGYIIENCKCGFDECRTYITGKDWLSSYFQKTNRFSLHIFEKIKNVDSQDKLAQLEKLQKIDLNKSKLLKKEYKVLING